MKKLFILSVLVIAVHAQSTNISSKLPPRAERQRLRAELVAKRPPGLTDEQWQKIQMDRATDQLRVEIAQAKSTNGPVSNR